MEYYSQEGQDTILKQFFDRKGITKGFYLDVGSVDGIHFSNTYMLEQEGWDGICVEAHPSYFPMLEENRIAKCYSCAAGDNDQESVAFSANYRSSLSSLDFSKESYYENSGYKPWYGDRDKSEINGIANGKIEVPMRKLDSILEENNVTNIDFISIDVDGSEPFTIKGLTLEKWQPTLLIMEHSIVEDVVFKYANDNGYHFAKKCGADSIFCKNESDVDIIKSINVIGNRVERLHPSELYFGAGKVS